MNFINKYRPVRKKEQWKCKYADHDLIRLAVSAVANSVVRVYAFPFGALAQPAATYDPMDSERDPEAARHISMRSIFSQTGDAAP